MSCEDAVKNNDKMTDYEKEECVRYDNLIYYVGQLCKTKIKGHPIKYVNVPP